MTEARLDVEALEKAGRDFAAAYRRISEGLAAFERGLMQGTLPAAAPAEGPCRFRKGKCITHGWEGPSHERKQLWCCPEFWTRAALARHESGSEK